MLNLNELRTDDLKKIMAIRRKMEVLEREMAEVLEKVKQREPPVSVSIRNMRLPRKAQPSLRELISKILSDAGRPLSVQDIYQASLNEGYQWRSQSPINALNVKMYTDRTFKKAAPGLFVQRNPAK